MPTLRSVPATTARTNSNPTDAVPTSHNNHNRVVKNVAPVSDDSNVLEEATQPTKITTTIIPHQPRTVRHWARVWIGKSTTVNGRYFVTWEQYEDVEVAVQQYGDPHWIEDLFTNMIAVAKEYLEDIPEGYSTVRLRVNLYSHRADSGQNAKFTLEHMERRTP